MAKKRKRTGKKLLRPIKEKRPKPKPKPRKRNGRRVGTAPAVTPKTKAAKPANRGKRKPSTLPPKKQPKGVKRPLRKPAKRPPRKPVKSAKRPPRKPVKPAKAPPRKPIKPAKALPRKPIKPAKAPPRKRKPRKPIIVRPPKAPSPDDDDYIGEKDREGPHTNGFGDVPHKFDAKEEVERALEFGYGPNDIPRAGPKDEDGRVLSNDPYYEYLAELAEMEPREIYEMFVSPAAHGVAA